MWTSTVESQTKFGVQYMVTTIFYNGIVKKVTFKEVSKIDKTKELGYAKLMRDLGEQEMAFLNNNI